MFRVLEVMFDENLDEVAYVIEGTEADFKISASTRNTARRLIYAKDLKERRATINKFISYKSGELELYDGMHHTVERAYLIKGKEVIEGEAEIKDIKKLVYKGLNGVEYSLNKFQVTVLGGTREVNILELRRLMKWLPSRGEFRIAKQQFASEPPISVGYRLFLRNFPFAIPKEYVSLDTVSPEFAYCDKEENYSITGFVRFVREIGGKFALKRDFDSSVLSDRLEIASVDEWEVAEPIVHYSTSKMAVYLGTKRNVVVRLRVGNKVLPKEYEITVKGAVPLVLNGRVVNHANLAVFIPSRAECNKLRLRYKELVLFNPINHEENPFNEIVGYYAHFIGLSVDGMLIGRNFSPTPMHMWFLLEEEMRLQREICEALREHSEIAGDKKVARFSTGEEQRLNKAKIDLVTMSVCTKAMLPSSQTGVMFRLPKSLAVPSNYELAMDEIIEKSAGELRDKLIKLREKLSCIEKLIWTTAHQHLKYERYRRFRNSKGWNLSFIGKGSRTDGLIFGGRSKVEVYSTALEGLTVTICHHFGREV